MSSETKIPSLADHQDIPGKGMRSLATSAGALLDDAGQIVAGEFALVGNKACGAIAAGDRLVHRQPWAVVGIAAVLGVLAGALLVRR